MRIFTILKVAFVWPLQSEKRHPKEAKAASCPSQPASSAPPLGDKPYDEESLIQTFPRGYSGLITKDKVISAFPSQAGPHEGQSSSRVVILGSRVSMAPGGEAAQALQETDNGSPPDIEIDRQKVPDSRDVIMSTGQEKTTTDGGSFSVGASESSVKVLVGSLNATRLAIASL